MIKNECSDVDERKKAFWRRHFLHHYYLLKNDHFHRRKEHLERFRTFGNVLLFISSVQLR